MSEELNPATEVHQAISDLMVHCRMLGTPQGARVLARAADALELAKNTESTVKQLMDDVAALRAAPPAPVSGAELTDEQILQAMEKAGVEFQAVYQTRLKADKVMTCGSIDASKIIAGARVLLAAEQPSEDKRDAWIRVEDDAPVCDMKDGAPGIEVFVWPRVEGGEATAFYGCRLGRRPRFYKYGTEQGGITHWMPLPDAPIDAEIAKGARA